MGKPNDFLGLLYVTFDYLCQLLTLFHGFDLQHTSFYNCEYSGAPPRKHFPKVLQRHKGTSDRQNSV